MFGRVLPKTQQNKVVFPLPSTGGGNWMVVEEIRLSLVSNLAISEGPDSFLPIRHLRFRLSLMYMGAFLLETLAHVR